MQIWNFTPLKIFFKKAYFRSVPEYNGVGTWQSDEVIGQTAVSQIKMKTILIIILSLLLTTFICAQNDTSERIVDVKNLVKRDIGNMIPDSNFITINNDTIVTGQIRQLCNFINNTSGHGVASQIGSLTIGDSLNQTEIQVIFIDNSKVQHLKKGDTATLELTKYNPRDNDFSEVDPLTCNIIDRLILICKLK